MSETAHEYISLQITDMVQGTRAAFDMMTREIRMAGYNPTGATFPGICYHSSHLHFRSDLNGDGDAHDTDEAIIYRFDSANSRINRIAGGETHVLADNIIKYYSLYQLYVIKKAKLLHNKYNTEIKDRINRRLSTVVINYMLKKCEKREEEEKINVETD